MIRVRPLINSRRCPDTNQRVGYPSNSMLEIVAAVAWVIGTALTAPAAAQPTASYGTVRIITGQSGSVAFLNNVRHGATTESGVLELPRVKTGVYRVRVRTVGFIDWVGNAVVTARTPCVLRLKQKALTDAATLHYQRGDELRDTGKHEAAVEEYRQALALRAAFPEARIGAARSLAALQKFDKAEDEIQAALKNPGSNLAEAHTVLANMRRQQGLIDESVAEYRKALLTARGVSPEAHIGLALALEESGKREESIKEFRTGIAQDMDTEPILYYLLGSALEKLNRNKEAIDAYANYLRLAPQGQYASAVESMIERLKENLNDR